MYTVDSPRMIQRKPEPTSAAAPLITCAAGRHYSGSKSLTILASMLKIASGIIVALALDKYLNSPVSTPFSQQRFRTCRIYVCYTARRA